MFGGPQVQTAVGQKPFSVHSFSHRALAPDSAHRINPSLS